MSAQPRTLVVICGPPAVGKMAVGRRLSELTGFPLFHNHLSIEAVLPIFPFGSPPFSRLVAQFRAHMFSEVAESDLPGFIFTYVWAFDQPSDLESVMGLKAKFEPHGFRIVFVELQAPLEVRLQRNSTEERLLAKPSKRDVEASSARVRATDKQYQLSSDGAFPFPDSHLLIDNSDLSPSDAARRIVTHFELNPAASA